MLPHQTKVDKHVNNTWQQKPSQQQNIDSNSGTVPNANSNNYEELTEVVVLTSFVLVILHLQM